MVAALANVAALLLVAALVVLVVTTGRDDRNRPPTPALADGDTSLTPTLY